MTDTLPKATSTPGRGLRASLPRMAQGGYSPWLLIPVTVWVMAAVAASNPLTDNDSYWHVLMGRDIVNNQRFTGDPAWVFGPHHDWVTTQWLSEVLFAGLHAVFGWAGLTYVTAVCAAAILVILTRNLREAIATPISEHPIVWVVFGFVGLAISADLQERPATISFVFLAVLSGWTWRALTTGVWPRWWATVLFTGLWAQLHGYWVMVALTITVVAIIRAVEHRTFDGWKEPFRLAAGCTLVGALTPAGPFGIYAPVVFRNAAGPYLTEWEATNLTGDTAVPLALGVVLLTVLAWARNSHRAPLGHVIWVIVWSLFAITAFRNVVPAAILIAPAAAVAVTTTWPHLGRTIKGTALTATILTAATLTGAGLFVGRLATGDPLPKYAPASIYTAITAQPGDRRVLNYYDLGGQVLAFTRPGVQVSIDGRSDMYGQKYLGPYMSMHRLGEGWETTFANYDPTDVITRDSYPLGQMLPSLGWHINVTEDGWTLWEKNTPPN